jgi:hypothetical protein
MKPRRPIVGRHGEHNQPLGPRDVPRGRVGDGYLFFPPDDARALLLGAGLVGKVVDALRGAGRRGGGRGRRVGGAEGGVQGVVGLAELVDQVARVGPDVEVGVVLGLVGERGPEGLLLGGGARGVAVGGAARS